MKFSQIQHWKYQVFLILTMSFLKACAFSKRATSSPTRFFRFVKSLSKLTEVRVRKLEKTSWMGKHLGCPTFGSYSFLHKSQNCARSVSLETRQCRLSIDTNFDQIWVPEDPQTSVQKRVLKGPKTCQNLIEIGQNVRSKQLEKLTQDQATWSKVDLLHAAPCYVRLSINMA